MRELVEQARQGSVRAATRLVSRLENDPTLLPELFVGMGDWPQPRLIVGLTGAPGVGKSTLADALISAWRKRAPEAKLGVLAVDPSSPFTGGAVLGDRVRMMKHALDEKVFIRSLASRGHLGGLTLGIKGALRVLGLYGCDVVMIETVGVGQSEVEVAGVADITLIALAPGQGDGVQLLKAGLMEAGDVFVVNKADRPGADKLYSELVATLGISGVVSRRESPEQLKGVGHTEVLNVPLPAETFKVTAATGAGVPELVEGIEARAGRYAEVLQARRAASVKSEVRGAILEAARRQVERQMINGRAEEIVQKVLRGEVSVQAEAESLMKKAVGKEV